jgi:hypothetical protein
LLSCGQAHQNASFGFNSGTVQGLFEIGCKDSVLGEWFTPTTTVCITRFIETNFLKTSKSKALSLTKAGLL